MGRGITAAIPIVLQPPRHGWHRKVENEDFPKLAEFYTPDESGQVYTIKHKILLENYQSFLTEFYDCIGEVCNFQEASNPATYDDFVTLFDRRARNARVPFVESGGSYLSIVGADCPEYWLFYSGSYKALLETYCTLTHFERVLARAMKNPLAGAVKFGIHG